jgi:hypothetical protein
MRLEDLGADELPESAPDVELGEPATAIALGDSHSCALLESGDVRCWGGWDSSDGGGLLGIADLNGHAPLGDDELPTAMPPVPLGEPAVQIAARYRHTCALLESGTVRCWGQTLSGLGYGDLETVGDDEFPADRPPIDLGGRAVQIACGADHTCAFLEHGGLRCFGSALRGQLGYGNEDDIGDDEPPAAAGDVPYLD